MPSLDGWDRGTGPLHRRLSAAIAELVRVGELDEGTVLPTERFLAEALSVSRSTVAHAFRSLKSAGVLDSRQGRGTWVATGPDRWGVIAERIAPLLSDHPGTVDLALAVPEPVVDLRVTVRSRVGGYEPAGLLALRESIAAHYGGAGLATTPDQVLVTSGAQHAISLVMAHLVGPGGTVVVEESTYVGALDAARSLGARIIAVPVDRHGVDVDALVEAVERHQPGLVYLNPTNQTPTGTVLADQRRRRIVRMAMEAGVPVLDDMVLAGLSFGDGGRDPLAVIDRRAPILTVGSVSKVVWAGLRVGWIRAERQVIEALTARRMVEDLGGSLPSQAAAVGLVRDYARHCADQASVLRARHDHLIGLLRSELPPWEAAPASGGTVLWVRLPDGSDAEVFAAVAEEHEVSVVAGSAVSAHGAARDRLRIAFVAPPAVLDEGVRRLVLAWDRYQGDAGRGPRRSTSVNPLPAPST